MKPVLQIKRVEDSHEWLEKVADECTAMQSISWYIDHIGTLSKSLAFINTQMAVAKLELNAAKGNAYDAIMQSGLELSPSILKDYVNAQLKEHQYNFDICDRARSTIERTIDAVRTCASALKTEYAITHQNRTQ